MYKNKHVVVAMIVAPILAILAYLGVDSMVSEKPHAAEPGSSYPLVEKPNCRYTSGVCELKNGEFEVRLLPEKNADNQLVLRLSSDHPLQGGKVALAAAEEKPQASSEKAEGSSKPLDFEAVDEAGTEWVVALPDASPDKHLRLVFSANDVMYFGEAQLTFVNYETTFGADFRHH